MRRLLASAVTAALTVPLAAPARAEVTAAVLVCNVRYFWVGGGYDVRGECVMAGTHTGTVLIDGFMPGSIALCPVLGTALGGMVGISGTAVGWGVEFQWTRVSAAGVITVFGSTTGGGVSAATDPCVSGTSESVVFTIAGV